MSGYEWETAEDKVAGLSKADMVVANMVLASAGFTVSADGAMASRASAILFAIRATRAAERVADLLDLLAKIEALLPTCTPGVTVPNPTGGSRTWCHEHATWSCHTGEIRELINHARS